MFLTWPSPQKRTFLQSRARHTEAERRCCSPSLAPSCPEGQGRASGSRASAEVSSETLASRRRVFCGTCCRPREMKIPEQKVRYPRRRDALLCER